MWNQGGSHPQHYQQQMQQQHMQQYMQQHMAAGYPPGGYDAAQQQQMHQMLLQQQQYMQQQMQQQQMQQQHTPGAYPYQHQHMYQQGYAFASPATASSYASPAAAASVTTAAAGPYSQGTPQMSPYGAAFGSQQPVPPPADAELAKRIRTMAEYCARNPDMERMVRQRDGSDPRFAFLSGGEGFEYYRYVLSCLEKGFSPDPKTPSPPPHHQQQQQQQQQQQMMCSYDPESILMLYRQRRLSPSEETLNPTQERELKEVLQTLETEATADAIRAARRWAEVCCSSSSNDTDPAAAAALAAAMYRHQKQLKTATHKLNALYLAHDIVQNDAVSKQSSALLTAFKAWLPWMAREAFQAANHNAEEEQKVDRVLSLWVERGVLDEDDVKEVSFFCRIPQQTLNPIRHDAERRAGGFSDHPASVMTPEPTRGFDRRPEELGLTPETVSVGVMATMLRSIIKRTRHMHAAFVPYRPLDPLATPQTTPPVEPPSDYLLDRLQDFYEDLEHIEENFRRKMEKEGRRGSLSLSLERSHSLSSGSIHSRSRSSSASLERKLEAREKERRLEGPEFNPKPERARCTNWVAAEMGLADDGSFAGPRGSARLGLGATAEPEKPQQPVDLSDPFERYRHQRAGRYHEVMAAHKAERKDLSRQQDRSCYLCGKVGHLARDCASKPRP